MTNTLLLVSLLTHRLMNLTPMQVHLIELGRITHIQPIPSVCHQKALICFCVVLAKLPQLFTCWSLLPPIGQTRVFKRILLLSQALSRPCYTHPLRALLAAASSLHCLNRVKKNLKSQSISKNVPLLGKVRIWINLFKVKERLGKSQKYMLKIDYAKFWRHLFFFFKKDLMCLFVFLYEPEVDPRLQNNFPCWSDCCHLHWHCHPLTISTKQTHSNKLYLTKYKTFWPWLQEINNDKALRVLTGIGIWWE